MLKKILIGVGVFAVIVVALLAYLNHRNRTLSPPGYAESESGELSVSIKYSKPSVRDRVVFGTEAEKALQPYGKYWGLGANEATVITFDKDVTFAGKSLSAGSYSLYAIPGEDSFVIGVNSEIDRWGYSEPDYRNDVARVTIPVEENIHTEQFTIDLEKVNDGVDMVVRWSSVKLTVPIRTKS